MDDKTNKTHENLNTIEINTHAYMIQKLNSILNMLTNVNFCIFMVFKSTMKVFP